MSAMLLSAPLQVARGQWSPATGPAQHTRRDHQPSSPQCQGPAVQGRPPPFPRATCTRRHCRLPQGSECTATIQWCSPTPAHQPAPGPQHDCTHATGHRGVQHICGPHVKPRLLAALRPSWHGPKLISTPALHTPSPHFCVTPPLLPPRAVHQCSPCRRYKPV